jgi:FtsH-binding integral membrane protein
MTGNRQWPLIPAGILFVVSIFALFEKFDLSSLIWAVILIAGGAFLVIRSLLQKNK